MTLCRGMEMARYDQNNSIQFKWFGKPQGAGQERLASDFFMILESPAAAQRIVCRDVSWFIQILQVVFKYIQSL